MDGSSSLDVATKEIFELKQFIWIDENKDKIEFDANIIGLLQGIEEKNGSGKICKTIFIMYVLFYVVTCKLINFIPCIMFIFLQYK